MSQKIQLRRDTAANWTTANPTLSAGEFGVETDTLKVKVGNGSTAWTALAYLSGAATGLATVATTGAYADLTGTPALGTAAAQATSAFDAAGAASAAQAAAIQRANHTGTQAANTITGLAAVATTGAYTDLSGKPTLGGAASLAVGTTTGTVAAGDDARITGAVPATRTVNGKPLSASVTLTAADVGAQAAGNYATPSEGGGWATTTAYTVGAVVTQAGKRYECATAHTAGTFATDLAADKWVLLGVDPASSLTLPANATGWLHDNGSGTLAWTTPTASDVGAAPLASPALTGTPTAPTATAGDNSTKLATTAFVATAVAGVSGGGGGSPHGIRAWMPASVTTNSVYMVGGLVAGGTVACQDTVAYLFPFFTDTSGTFYLGASVSTAGSTGSVLRFAVFTDNAGLPGTATDLGTIGSTTTDGNSVTARYGPTSVALTASTLYWAGIASQGGATTQPLLRIQSALPWSLPPIGTTAGSAYKTGGVITSAFASSPTPTGMLATPPAMYLKAV